MLVVCGREVKGSTATSRILSVSVPPGDECVAMNSPRPHKLIVVQQYSQSSRTTVTCREPAGCVFVEKGARKGDPLDAEDGEASCSALLGSCRDVTAVTHLRVPILTAHSALVSRIARNYLLRHRGTIE